MGRARFRNQRDHRFRQGKGRTAKQKQYPPDNGPGRKVFFRERHSRQARSNEGLCQQRQQGGRRQGRVIAGHIAQGDGIILSTACLRSTVALPQQLAHRGLNCMRDENRLDHDSGHEPDAGDVHAGQRGENRQPDPGAGRRHQSGERSVSDPTRLPLSDQNSLIKAPPPDRRRPERHNPHAGLRRSGNSRGDSHHSGHEDLVKRRKSHDSRHHCRQDIDPDHEAPHGQIIARIRG